MSILTIKQSLKSCYLFTYHLCHIDINQWDSESEYEQ